ncbi:MAG: RidA family protein [Bacteroidia bacterium]|nr:RidA family protein [Bacteroidia bacterium]
MEGKIVKDKAKPLGNYPHLKRVGDFIFVSGTSSRRKDNSHAGATQDLEGNWHLDIKEQTRAVIENIGEILQSEGADLSHVIDMTSFLVDMKDFECYNEVYGSYFNGETGPTRTTVGAHQLPHAHLLIEMKAIAYKRLNK